MLSTQTPPKSFPFNNLVISTKSGCNVGSPPDKVTNCPPPSLIIGIFDSISDKETKQPFLETKSSATQKSHPALQ